MRAFRVADLFCGAGGTSTGAIQACIAAGRRAELVAVNHWDRAVETHAANHPDASHHCEDLTTMDPRKAVPGGKLDLLVASPECTHHSVARGGMPCSDQSRASAWCVMRWVTSLQVDRVLIENVPEFVSWGPLGTNGKPLASRRGEIFKSFVDALKASGYRVDWRVLNSADYGAATSRRRLFLQAARGRREIVWPDQTHDSNPSAGLFAGVRKKWRAAREVIDWQLLGNSIFGRKRPLSDNTLARIEAGLRKFGGKNAEPFLVLLKGTQAGHLGSSAKSVDGPVPALTTGNSVGLCEPFILPHRQFEQMDVDSVAKPMRTITAQNGACNALVQPFIVPQMSSNGPRSIDDPVPTLTTTSRGVGVCEPFLVPYYGACHEADSINDPARTVTTKDRLGIVEPKEGQRLDILFRMLQPHELAAAMGFPAGYKITGNRGEQVKQIGNAVEVNQARSLVQAIITRGAAL